MTDPAKKTSDKKEPTSNQRIALEYEKSPHLMTRMLADIFSEIHTEQEMGVHNRTINEIGLILGEGLPKVLEKIANVVLQNTVSNLGD